MALRFDWSKLDDTTADILRRSINEKIGLQLHSHGGTLPAIIKELQLTHLTFGDVSPFVEIQAIEPAVDFSPSMDLLPSVRSPCSSAEFSTPSTPAALASTARPRTDSQASFAEANRSTQRGRTPDHTPRPHDSTSNCDETCYDSLAPFLGPSGLFLKLHATYGGDLAFTIKLVVAHRTEFAPNCAMTVRLPVSFTVTGVRLDVSVNVNLHKNACQVWFDEGGSMSSSPLQRLAVTTVAGSERPDAETQPVVDTNEVAECVLQELQAVLHHRLVSPHYMEFPVVIGGGGRGDHDEEGSVGTHEN